MPSLPTDIRRTPDIDLTGEFDYLLREMCELGDARIMEDGGVTLWRLGCLKDEYDRRMRLSKSGGPSVKTLNVSEVAKDIKARMSGDRFISLVESATDAVVLKKGTRYWGTCPAHTDKHPSLCVFPDKCRCHCFQCHSRWDVFDMVMCFPPHISSFTEAVQYVGSLAGIDITVQRMQLVRSNLELAKGVTLVRS
ncbi:MAG: hypothetical protein HYX87_00075 [Chloroflexi bacterium]|nr:hypothetical protein [Chloroflexota bacterium]